MKTRLDEGCYTDSLTPTLMMTGREYFMTRGIVSLVLAVFILITAGCSPEASAWREVLVEDSLETYQDFLATYPDSEHVAQAESRIGELRIAIMLNEVSDRWNLSVRRPVETGDYGCGADASEMLASYEAEGDVTLSFDSLTETFGWNGQERVGRADNSLSGVEIDESGNPVMWGNLCFGNLQVQGRWIVQDESILLKVGTAISVVTRYVDETLPAETESRPISEEEIQDLPLEYFARHILVDSEEEARAVIDLLNDGGDFAALAVEYSTGPSGPNGGDLGWFAADVMVPPFADAVRAMEVGSYSVEPVPTQFGWHVIFVEETRDQQPQ